MGMHRGERGGIRRHRGRRRTVVATVGLLILVLINGCASGGDRRSRGKASTVAARAAADGQKGRGEGRTRTKTDHQTAADTYRATVQDSPGETWVDDAEEESSFLFNLIAGLFSGGGDDDASRQGDQAKASAGNPSTIDRRNLLLAYSQGNPAGDAISSLETVSLNYSFYGTRRTRLFFGLYGGEGTKGSRPLIQEGLSQLTEFGADVGARTYLTPRHTLAGVYILYGARLGGLSWHYADMDQEQAAAADLPTSDTVTVFTPYLGVGCSVVQVKALHFGASVSYGARISGEKTFAEYENDLFPTVEEVRWTIDLSVFF